MVAIKLIVASLASLALAHPIEPRSPDLGSSLSGLLGNLGNTVGGLLSDVLSLNGPDIANDISGVLGKVSGLVGDLGGIVGKIDPSLGQTVDDLLKNSGLENIINQVLVTVDEAQQKLLNSKLSESALNTVKGLLGEVTSLKGKLSDAGASSDVTDKLGNLEGTLQNVIDEANKATQS